MLKFTTQRFRKVTAEKPEAQSFNGVVIAPDGARSCPTHREYIAGSLTEILFPISPSSPLLPHFMTQVIEGPNFRELIRFYDRDPQICDWYYQVFGYDSNLLPGATGNSVANILCTSRQFKFVGNIVIVKNGPAEGRWVTTPDIDLTALGQTLWWYQRSGRDVGAVCNERSFMRLAAIGF